MKPDRVEELPLERVAATLESPGTVVWVDLEQPTPEEAAILRDVFRFHPLAIEDALVEQLHPKLDDYGSYLYVVLHGVLSGAVGDDGSIEQQEIDFFLGKGFLVTHHDKPSPSIAAVAERVGKQPERFQGADFVFAAVAEAMVDRFMPVVASFDDRIDSLEDDVFTGRASARVLERMFGYKRSALMLRRTMLPQREVIRNLSAGGYAQVSREAQLLLRDTHDHLFTIAEMIESYRDLIAGTMEAHLSVTSNKLNEVMKRLTIITTVLMPISLVTGVYGMNVSSMPGTTGPHAFWELLGGMGALGLVTVAFLRWRNWL